jgi:hypothetical protein
LFSAGNGDAWRQRGGRTGFDFDHRFATPAYARLGSRPTENSEPNHADGRIRCYTLPHTVWVRIESGLSAGAETDGIGLEVIPEAETLRLDGMRTRGGVGQGPPGGSTIQPIFPDGLSMDGNSGGPL